MDCFTAIDFETAQGYRWSICQVGLVRIENGIVTKEINLLVQPPDNYYWSRFTDIHGISAKDTKNAPTFDQIWPQIATYIENKCGCPQLFWFSCFKQNFGLLWNADTGV